jgi:hypothetical protein
VVLEYVESGAAGAGLHRVLTILASVISYTPHCQYECQIYFNYIQQYTAVQQVQISARVRFSSDYELLPPPAQTAQAAQATQAASILTGCLTALPAL